MDVKVKVADHSKDLFTSWATQKNSIDRSNRNDVAYFRYECRAGCTDEISWIPGRFNLADVLTEPDSPLSETLQLTPFTGRLQMDYKSELETQSSEKNYG